MFAITGQDLWNTTANNVYSFGYLVAGAAITAAVQKVAHAVFGVKNDALASAGLRLITFAAVSISAVLYQPETVLTVFTMDKSLRMLVLSLGVALAGKILVGVPLYPFLGEGALAGYLGQSGLILNTCVGAAFGALV